MMPRIKGQHFKWYAVASIAVVGWVAAVIIPPYNHITNAPLPILRALAIVVTLLAAILVTGLAIKNTEQILGRCALSVLMCLYVAMLFGMSRAIL